MGRIIRFKSAVPRQKTKAAAKPKNGYLPWLFTGIIIVALTVFLAFLPCIPPFKQYILSFAERKFSSFLFCNVKIGSISVDMRKELIAENIVLSDPQHRLTQIDIERLTAQIDFKALLKKRLELHYVNVAGLKGELLNTHTGLFAGPVDIGRMTAAVSKDRGKAVVESKPAVRMISAEGCTVSYIDSVINIAASETIQSIRLEFISADSMAFVMQAGTGHFLSTVWRGEVCSTYVQGTVGPASISFNGSKVKGDSVLLSFSGIIPFTTDKSCFLKANIETFSANFPYLYKKNAQLKPAGKLKVNGVMKGTFRRPDLKAAFTGYGLQAGRVTADTLFIQADYSDYHLSGNARLWSRPWNADAGFYAVISGFKRLPDTMSINIKKLTGSALSGPANLDFLLARNKWNLIAAIKPDLDVKGNGMYGNNGAISGSIHLKADTITRIASLYFKEKICGSIIADALFSGTLKKPVATASVGIGQCSYGKYHADTVSANLNYAGQRVQWQSLIVKLGKSVIQGDGAVLWTKRNGSVNTYCKLTSDNHAAGTISAKALFADNSVEASAALEGLDPEIVLPWFPQAQQLHGSLRADINGKAIKAEDGWMLSCSTHVVNYGLTMKAEDFKAGQTILDMRISGPLLRPVIGFSLSGDSIEYKSVVITGYSAGGSITGDVLKLDTLHLSCIGGSADMSGIVPLTFKKKFLFDENCSIHATFNAIPVSIMQPFFPDFIEINKGEISGRLVAEGTANGIPKSEGTISLVNGELYIYECDKPLGPLSVDIYIKNDSIVLRRLQAKWGKGRIEGSGLAMIGAKGISTAQSHIKMSDISIDGCNENLDLGIKAADIDLAWDSLITVTANARLADTRFVHDFSLVNFGEQIKKKTIASGSPNPLFDKVVMRISVDCNNNLTFDSNIGKMLIDGSVLVVGRPDKPEVSGQFQIVNGFVYYLDKKFTVTDGAIRQYDPKLINPLLNITATSSVSYYPPKGEKTDYDITLLVKGDLSNPLITLSAVPSLSQPQIISLLTLGTIQAGMGTGTGSQVGSIASLQLAGFGTRKLARFINVESVDIYGNAFGTSSAGPQLSVTKQISSRIAVTYKTGLSGLSQQMLLVSYRLLSFLYLEAETDQQAQGGIDLKLRYSR